MQKLIFKYISNKYILFFKIRLKLIQLKKKKLGKSEKCEKTEWMIKKLKNPLNDK